MAPKLRTNALTIGLALVGIVAAAPVSAQTYWWQSPDLRPSTRADLSGTRSGAYFFADPRDAVIDYDSFTYDDRYHGPSPFYGPALQPYSPYYYYYGHPMFGYSTGGTLRYWPRR